MTRFKTMKIFASLTWVLAVGLTMTTVSGARAQNEPPKPQTPPPVATPSPSPSTVASTGPKKMALPPNLKLSAWAKEIVKLAEAGIDEDVMISFVDNSGTFNLGADQIIYLSDLGVSSAVTHAMLQHDQEIIAGVRPLTISSDPGYEPIVETKTGAVTNAIAKPTEPMETPTTALVPAKAPASQAAATQETASSDFFFDDQPGFNQRHFSPDKKKYFYPVREPRPVTLTSTVVVYKGTERMPNTYVIWGFPRDER